MLGGMTFVVSVRRVEGCWVDDAYWEESTKAEIGKFELGGLCFYE